MDTPFSLPTPPTLEQRLDAAAEAYHDYMFSADQDKPTWADRSRKQKNLLHRQIEFICRAFAPEHFKD